MTRATPGAVLAALSGQDRVVIIRRPLVDWLGCDVQARLLDQCLYEADKAGGEWFAVTDAEWCDRLLVAQHKLAPARVALVARGLLETDRRGIPARLFYQMDAENVFASFADWLGSRELVLALAITGDAPAQNRRCARAEHTISKMVEDSESTSGAQAAPPPAPTLDANTSKESNGQPTDTDRTPPPVPLTPPTPKPRASKAPKADPAPRERDPFFDAFCRAFGLPADGGKKAGLAGAFSADCKREGATLDQFRSFYRANAGEWGKFNCQPHNVGGAFLAWRIGQGMAGDPMADAAEIMPDGKPYDPFNVKHYLARKAIREAADTERMRAAR